MALLDGSDVRVGIDMASISSMHSAASIFQDAGSALILTGPSLSAESGIPEEQDVLPELRAEMPLWHLRRIETYARKPELVWGWFEWLRMRAIKAQPNSAHYAVTRLSEKLPITLATNNLDDLHERAGSLGTLHLNGSLNLPYCVSCRRPHAFPSGTPDEPEVGRKIAPPSCIHCGGRVMPGPVYCKIYGTEAHTVAQSVAEKCDVLLLVGNPDPDTAQRLAVFVARRGQPVIQMGNESTRLDQFVNVDLKGAVSELLPMLVSCALQGK